MKVELNLRELVTKLFTGFHHSLAMNYLDMMVTFTNLGSLEPSIVLDLREMLAACGDFNPDASWHDQGFVISIKDQPTNLLVIMRMLNYARLGDVVAPPVEVILWNMDPTIPLNLDANIWEQIRAECKCLVQKEGSISLRTSQPMKRAVILHREINFLDFSASSPPLVQGGTEGNASSYKQFFPAGSLQEQERGEGNEWFVLLYKNTAGKVGRRRSLSVVQYDNNENQDPYPDGGGSPAKLSHGR